MTNENSNFQMLMRLAVRNCEEEDFAEFQTMDPSDTEVHPRIRRKVRQAIRKAYLRESIAWRILRNSAVACLVIITVLFSAVMAIPPVREALRDALVTWHERYICVAFETDAEYPETIETRHLPQLPEGWTMTVIGESDKSIYYRMIGPDEKYVTYQQSVYTGREQKYDNTECDIQKILLNDQTEALLITYHSELSYNVSWADQYCYSLTGYSVTPEELIALAESVR